MRFYKIIKSSLEPILLDLGFKLISKSGGAIHYSRKKNGIEESIRFVIHRFSPEWNVDLEKENNEPPAIELRRLSKPKAYPWWSYSTEEEMMEGLKEVKEILLNEGIRWFEGKIDYWSLFEE